MDGYIDDAERASGRVHTASTATTQCTDRTGRWLARPKTAMCWCKATVRGQTCQIVMFAKTHFTWTNRRLIVFHMILVRSASQQSAGEFFC